MNKFYTGPAIDSLVLFDQTISEDFLKLCKSELRIADGGHVSCPIGTK